MKKQIIILLILALISPKILFSQSNKRLLTIDGQVLNHKDESIEGRATIQLIGKDNKVKRATRVDVDGYFRFIICPNQLIQDTLKLKVAAIGYEIETINLGIPSSKIHLKLTKLDSSMTFDTYKKNDAIMMSELECGTGYFEEHEYFKNCAGEIRKGSDLRDTDANILEWTAIEK